jgi:hypothetical protein
MNGMKRSFGSRHTMVRRELPQLQIQGKRTKTHRTTQRSWRGRFYAAQQGGAQWYDGLATEGERRITYWRAELTERNLMGEFSFILEKRNPTDSAAETAEQQKQKIDQFLKLIEQQDLLFDVALGAICRDINERLTIAVVPGDYESLKGRTTEIDALRGDMIEYLKDVEKLLFFGTDDTVDSTLGATKLQQIYTNPDEPLSTLLLYPWRLNNVFILSMAKLFVSLKEDSSILEDIRDNESVTTLISSQWNSFFLSMVYSLTSRPPRDGFFLNQGETDFMKNYIEKEGNSVKTYWYNLAEFMGNEVNIFTGEGCKNLREPMLYSKITAGIFAEYKAGRLASLLKAFESCDISAGTPEFDQDLQNYPTLRGVLPEEQYWNTEVGRGSTSTMKKLLEQMNDSTLQYMIHLAYTIQKQEEEKATSAPNDTSEDGDGNGKDEIIQRKDERIRGLEETLEKTLEEVSGYQTALQRDITTLRQSLTEEQGKYRMSPDDIARMQTQMNRIAALQTQIDQLTSQLRAKNSEIGSRTTETTATIQQKEQAIQDLKRTLEGAEDQLVDFQTKLHNEMEDLRQSLEEEQRKYRISPEDEAKLQFQTAQIEAFEKQIEDLTSQLRARNAAANVGMGASARAMMPPMTVRGSTTTAPIPTPLITRDASEKVLIRPRNFATGHTLFSKAVVHSLTSDKEENYANQVTNALYKDIQRIDDWNQQQRKQLVQTALFPADFINFVTKDGSSLRSIYDGFTETKNILMRLFQDATIAKERKGIIVANAIRTLYSDHFTTPL